MNKISGIAAIFVFVFSVLSSNSSNSQDSQPQRRSNQWRNVEILSSTNALFAVDSQTRKPLWSESGEFYRESFDFDDLQVHLDGQLGQEENQEMTQLPPSISVEHLIQFGRLYAVLDRSAIRPQKGNVLLAFDLEQQGKVVWRLAAPSKTAFQSLLSLVRDQLTFTLSDGTTLQLDVATGEISQ